MPGTSSGFLVKSGVLIGGLVVGWSCFLEVNPDDGGQEFVHALLVGNVRVGLAPHKQHVAQQLQHARILEKLQFLIGAAHILLDLLGEETVRFLQ